LIDDMPRPRPQHLHREINRHGDPAWYVRVGKGPRIRIKGIYGSQEFKDAYQAALIGRRALPPNGDVKGTLQWLANLYRQSQA
jgi:hypothetical protein